jgi:hypothetical protein
MPEEFTSSDLMGAILSLREATDLNFGTLRREIDERFDGVDGRFDGIESRLGGVETRLTTLEGEVRGIRNWTRHVDQRFEAIAAAAKITDA